MTQHHITDAECAAALVAGQEAAEAEVRAQAIRSQSSFGGRSIVCELLQGPTITVRRGFYAAGVP